MEGFVWLMLGRLVVRLSALELELFTFSLVAIVFLLMWF
jgi:hypothetical protein